MSQQQPPKPTIDYQSPPPEPARFPIGTFVGSTVVWTIASPFIVLLALEAMFGMERPWGPLLGAGGLLIIVGSAFFAASRIRSKKQRTAVIAGTICGMVLAGLLVGGCFAAFSGMRI